MNSESDISDDDLYEFEGLMPRRLPRGKGKFTDQLPIICFSCNKVGHIVARCTNREKKDERKERNYKGRRDDKDNKRNKDYKDKGKKLCYIVEEETNNESDSNDEEVFYVDMKEDPNEDEKTTLISYVSKGDRWIIDNG